MILYLIILIHFTIPLSSNSEELSYLTAVRNTLKHSARIKVKEEEIKIAEAEYRQQFAALYPEVSLNSKIERFGDLDNRDEQSTVTISNEVIGGNQDSWRSSVYALGQYRLSNWYKKDYEVSYYEKMQSTKVQDCIVEVKNVCRELIDLYMNAGISKIRLRFHEKILTCLEGVYKLKQKAKAKGEISEEEMLKAAADLSRVRKEAAAVRRGLLENFARMAVMTGEKYTEETSIIPFDVEGVSSLTTTEGSETDAPEYKARLVELEALRVKAKSAENADWPDISIYARYDYYGDSQRSLDDALHNLRTNSYTTGVYISLPLIDGGLRAWKKRQNNAEIRHQEQILRAAGEKNSQEVNRLQSGYAELTRSVEQYRKLLDQYEKLLQISSKAGKLGERNDAEVLSMEKEKLTIESELLTSEQILAGYEKKLLLEQDFERFIAESKGENTCQPCQ